MKKHTTVLASVLTSFLFVSCQTPPKPGPAEDPFKKPSDPLPSWTQSKKRGASSAVQVKVQSKLIENTFEPGSQDIPKKRYEKRLNEKELQVYLRKLAQKKGTDIMTSPSVVTRPGETATIQVGKQFTYPSLKKPDTFEEEIEGVTQYFKTRPSRNGSIKVDSVIEVKEFEKFHKRKDGKEQPVFKTRRIDKSFTLPRGQSIVLGGLVTDETQRVEDKVPLLGDIPLLGRAFSSKSELTLKKELIVIISPAKVDATGKPIR